jgi:hypothetical protein
MAQTVRTPPVSEDPSYHLIVDPSERPVLELALRLLHDDMSPSHEIRRATWRALERLRATVPDAPASIALDEMELKLVHTALHILLDDTRRTQEAERRVIRELLGKLPDDHAMRAIRL